MSPLQKKKKLQSGWHDTSDYNEPKRKFETDIRVRQGLWGPRKEAGMIIIVLAVS